MVAAKAGLWYIKAYMVYAQQGRTDDAVANRGFPAALSDRSAAVAVNGICMDFVTHLALRDVTLDIPAGAFVTLLGASGCGKTTLLNLIAGLLTPTAGSVTVRGERVTGPGAARTMVFQDDAVFPWYTVARNVEYGLRVQGVPKQRRRERVREMVDLVGLAGREDAYPHQLSGGMRKRVDVARALAVNPSVLLMDEPFAALDAMTKSRLQLEFLRIWEASRMTVIFVTHDIEEALLLSDLVAIMAPRPGPITRVVDVPFPRPRNDELRTSPAFQALRRELTGILSPGDEQAQPRPE
jgi:NitT/TauT family transport system ATP-binding protein